MKRILGAPDTDLVPVDFNKAFKRDIQLNASAAIPSYTHIYSVTTQFIRQWFLSKFNDGFFKCIGINDSHILDELRLKFKDEVVKQEKPKVAITPAIDYDYDNNTLNQNQFGLDGIVMKGNLDRCFIKDYRKNVFIGMGIEEHRMKYNFKMIFSTKAQQLDMLKYVNMAFSIGNTKTLPLDIDYHIPYSVMLQLAEDIGIGEVKNGKITDIIGFLQYVNDKAELPILYKLNTGSGLHQFYVRMKNSSIWISSIDRIGVDEGESEGMLKNNFGLEFNIEILIPGPKLYVYYSSNKITHVNLLETSNSLDGTDEFKYNINTALIPEIDENGWTQYLISDYEQEENLTEIDFSGLFQELRIYDMIEYHNKITITSDLFINIKLFLHDHQLGYTFDWKRMVLILDEPLHMVDLKIALYMDTIMINNFNNIKENIHNRFN